MHAREPKGVEGSYLETAKTADADGTDDRDYMTKSQESTLQELMGRS